LAETPGASIHLVERIAKKAAFLREAIRVTTAPGTVHLADIGDIHGMSDYAIKILQDDDTLKRFKANAMAHAKNFDIHRIVPQYEALYNRFLTLA